MAVLVASAANPTEVVVDSAILLVVVLGRSHLPLAPAENPQRLRTSRR